MIEGFIRALDAAGLSTTQEIIPDGQLHRYHVKGDKKGSTNGWYVLHADSIWSGVFGSWKYGMTYKWCSKGDDNLNPSEWKAIEERKLQACQQRKCEQEIKQEEARHIANAIWSRAEGDGSVSFHFYLRDKKVKSHGLGFHQETLTVPMHDIDGVLRSLQFIDWQGKKRFLSGGQKKGCFFQIGELAGVLCICEGYATGASIYEATGHTVAVAFDAGNLKPVAQALRKKYPRLKLIICADNDTKAKVNIGVIKAKEAAIATRALLAIPPCDGDFNDYYSGVMK